MPLIVSRMRIANKTTPLVKGVMDVIKYKHIEAAREVRLWIGQIIVPAATIAVAGMSIPEVREAIAAKAKLVKRNINKKLKQN